MSDEPRRRLPRSTGPELLKPGQTRAEYLALRDKWYAKLKRKGFVDFEVFGKDGDCLPIFSQTIAERSSESFNRRYASTYDYYARCRQFLESCSRRRPKGYHRRVWARHCDGLSQRDLAAAFKTTRTKIRVILHRCHKNLALWWRDTRREREQDEADRLAAALTHRDGV